jgi:hypothetical protein
MIIWRRWGILVPVFLFGGLVIAQLLADAIGGPGTYRSNSLIYGGAGVTVGGILTFLVARWDETRNPPQTLIDKETGAEIVFRTKSDLFFIPMKFWGLLGIVIGPIAIAAGFLKLQ